MEHNNEQMPTEEGLNQKEQATSNKPQAAGLMERLARDGIGGMRWTLASSLMSVRGRGRDEGKWQYGTIPNAGCPVQSVQKQHR
ncbi:hypothetical protein CTA1_808 [Colletotrichum tanaceti]|uniref:Uncharacterized protein n=1 Tax=Colletotrichum tanaceti TaxID=1306861 RepID=A0A4U6XQH6_9PEZI|nr:hypothetical protein CTA1_808 [Colletotrichum tanaceti]